ncbi:MAG: hypothetical protein ACLQT6_19205 [Desulfomonilaceae bacterium]
MKNTLINTRVRSLEEMMADLIATVEQTSLEMREFKDEWRYQAEMREFKDESRYQAAESKKEWRDEMREFAEHMERDTVKFKESTNEILDRMERESAKFKEDSKQDRRELNKQLGEIANKQGRMTEDLVAPSICRILKDVLGCPSSHECSQAERVRRLHPTIKGRRKEFDVIAECDAYILVNETKSKLKQSDIPELKETILEFREYFPGYKDLKVIGSLATLDVDESLVKYASREGVLILAVGDELMDVKNEPGFKAAIF